MNVETIRKIQQALVDKGFVPGEVDGVWGRRSIAAVRAFQESRHLRPDGIVGPKTLAALFDNPTQAPAQPPRVRIVVAPIEP